MPVIEVKIGKGRSEEKKQELVSRMTDLIVEVLDVRREWVTILLNEYERENWASDGKLHSIKYGKGFGKMGVEDKEAL